MRCQSDVLMLGVSEREGKEENAGKKYFAVEVASQEGRAVQMQIPEKVAGLIEKVRANFGRTCRVVFSVEPGREFKQFHLNLLAVEPVPVAPK